jgi:hypothetical protein
MSVSNRLLLDALNDRRRAAQGQLEALQNVGRGCGQYSGIPYSRSSGRPKTSAGTTTTTWSCAWRSTRGT